MPTATNGDVSLYYETRGDPAAEPLLLVRGLGSQLTHWDEEFRERFVSAGFFVISFDNRDVGLSSRLHDAQTLSAEKVAAGVAAGERVARPYSMLDMADDGLAVLDDLGHPSAHVLGTSLGGAIAQRMAIHHPKRLRSLVSLMSATSDPDVGRPTPEALKHLLAPTPTERAAAIDHALAGLDLYGSPGCYADPEARARERERQGRIWDRDHGRAGRARQFAAIATDGSRSALLASVEVPTLVMHGADDKLISLDGGERTAEVIPDARLVIIDGMGHDHPPSFWPRLVDEVASFAL